MLVVFPDALEVKYDLARRNCVSSGICETSFGGAAGKAAAVGGAARTGSIALIGSLAGTGSSCGAAGGSVIGAASTSAMLIHGLNCFCFFVVITRFLRLFSHNAELAISYY